MTLRLRDVCSYVPDLQLVAGSKGLDAPVRWMHMVETEEVASFLQGQEIAFITGIGLSEPQECTALVEAIFDEFASAIVINTGPYIPEIPPAVIAFCESHAFPLFQIPWSIHIPDIMHRISSMLIDSEQHALFVSSAFRSIIRFPNQSDLYRSAFEQSGRQLGERYRVAVMRISPQARELAPADRMRALRRVVDNTLASHGWQASQLEVDGNLVLVIPHHPEGDHACAMVQTILDASNELFFQERALFAGLGHATRTLHDLASSYHQALDITYLQAARGVTDTVADISTMGVYRLLLGLSDTRLLHEYYASTLEPLEAHDDSGDDLLEVLELYLAYGGSVKAVAQDLYVHRNTVTYRIKKIERILDCDLSQFSVREELSLAFHVRDVLRARKPNQSLL